MLLQAEPTGEECCTAAVVVGVIILIVYVLYKLATPISIWSAGRNVRRGLEHQQVQYVQQQPAPPPPPMMPPPPPQVMCPYCHAPVPWGYAFCGACGRPLGPPPSR